MTTQVHQVEKHSCKAKRSHIDIIVTKEEHDIIESKAKLCHMTKSAYLRALGLDYEPKQMMTPEQEAAFASFAGARQELIGISNALNSLDNNEKIKLFKTTEFMKRWKIGVETLIKQWTDVRNHFININSW